jgi:hypothetical protein
MWTGDIAGSAAPAQITFALSISSWFHRAGSHQAMFISEPCTRRTHLPSWTWAGWHGTVSWRIPPNTEHCAYMSDLIKATTPSIVWGANIYLTHPGRQDRVQLLNRSSALRLTNGTFSRMEIRNPFILNKFHPCKVENREWSWGRQVGRPGREQRMSHSFDKATDWWRIGGRLAFTSMSITITQQEWTARHVSGDFISVLVFAGRFLDVEHGAARFLTLRRLPQSSPTVWERVGMLSLTLPFLAKCRNVSGLFHKIPASAQSRSVVIQ